MRLQEPVAKLGAHAKQLLKHGNDLSVLVYHLLLSSCFTSNFSRSSGRVVNVVVDVLHLFELGGIFVRQATAGQGFHRLAQEGELIVQLVVRRRFRAMKQQLGRRLLDHHSFICSQLPLRRQNFLLYLVLLCMI